MKNLNLILLLFFSWAMLSPASGQEEIQFGSNNGKYISIFSTNIYYEEYGEGPALLLLHGGLGSIHDFAKVIPGLSDQYKVIAIDSPGHGRSGQADSLSFKLLASYYSEFIDLMKLDSVYVLGYSDGGNTALVLASDKPDKVKRVVISGANSNTKGYSKEAVDLIGMLNPDFVETYFQEWLSGYLNNTPQKDQWKKFIIDIKKMWLEEVVINDSELEEIEARFLIVLGDKDLITLEHGIQMHRTIKGSEFCVLPNTPHEVFMARPNLINLVTVEFFNKR